MQISSELVFVIGAHRSATSAFAGSLTFLGAALPARLLDANGFSPKGYFESKSVVAANDRFLAEMGRQWNECRPLPQLDGLLRERAVDRCEQLLRTEFHSSPIFVVKDPRISLLAPVWIEAAQQMRRRPSFILMLREPVASAASIMRRDGMSEEAAIALWLRYMFDAERNSRGCPRTIVRAESFVRDPVANLDMVGAALGLHWPTTPELVRDALTTFLDFNLLKAQPDMASPLADFATEAHRALLDLSSEVESDETVAYERIDTLRADFEAMSPKIHERMVFDQLGKAVTLKWKSAELDAVGAERDDAIAELDAVGAERDAAIAKLDTAIAERDAAIAKLDAVRVQLEKVLWDLTRTMHRPLKIWRDLIGYRVLTLLLKARPLLPNKMARRFVRSATKRDPDRFLQNEAIALLDGSERKGLDANEALRKSREAELETFLQSSDSLTLPRADNPKVSIVLVLWNQAALTLACLRSIQMETRVPLEVIIVDNASTDQTDKLLSQTENASVLVQTENLGFLKAVNLGLEASRGDHVLLLNNDAVLRPGTLAAALDVLESSHDIGAVGGRIILPDGKLQEAGSIIWADGSCCGYGRGDYPQRGQYMFRRDVDYCSGAFLLVNGRLFRDMNGFDEAYSPAYYEETDLCMRLRSAGYRIVFDPGVVIDHFEFASSEKVSSALDLQKRNKDIFSQKHSELLKTHLPPFPSNTLQARMRDQRSRVLHIDDQVPISSLGAGLPRTQEILRILSSGGNFVTYFPSTGEDTSWAEIRSCIPDGVEVASGYGLAQLESFLEDRACYYDTIFISRPHNMAELARIKIKRPELLSGVRIVYDAEALYAARDMVKAEIFGDSQSRYKLEKARIEELKLAEHADLITAVSPLEAEQFLTAAGAEVSILGNSMVPSPTLASFAQRNQILFLGRLVEDDSPNVDSIVWFSDKVLPILRRLLPQHGEIVVAGRSSAVQVLERAGKGLKLLGPIEDLPATFERARVFIAPTRFAAGIPLKVHQAAAMGVPIVATSILARQVGWKDGESLLVADTPEDFATAVASLYEDEELWHRLRASALSKIESDCSPVRFRDTLLSAVSHVAVEVSPKGVDDMG